MHSADAAGSKNSDAGPVSNKCGRGHGRCTIELPCRGDRKIAARYFSNVLICCQAFELRQVETNAKFSVENSDRRRYGAALPDDLFERVGCFEILGVGKSVGNDRRFERNDRLLSAQSRTDLVANLQMHLSDQLSDAIQSRIR